MKFLRQAPYRLAVLAVTVALTPLFGIAPAAAAADTVTYTANTSLELTGVPITLTILSGSAHGNSLTVGPTSFTLPSYIGSSLTIRYPGPNPKKFTDGTTTYCTYASGNNDFVFTSTHVNKTISIDATECAAPPSGGGGGSSPSAYTTPYVTMSAPNGGQSLSAGANYSVLWSAGGTGVSAIRIMLSTDSGVSYPTTVVASIYNSSYYGWTVPDLNTAKARIKVEAVGSTGSVLASDASDSDFTIVGTAPTAVEETAGEEETTAPETPTDTDAIAAAEAAAPATDSNATGGYSAGSATQNTPTINVDKQLKEPEEDPNLPEEEKEPPLCQSGSLIKGTTSSTVYYCGKDIKRYVFPNEKIFLTWYQDFSSVITLADSVLAKIPLGGNVTYKPGVRMVKIQTDPKTYAIARGGILRWVQTEAVAAALYGPNWNQKIDDVSDAFFVNYIIGPPITSAGL